MSGVARSSETGRISARELREKTPAERDSILESQASLAEHAYRRDVELTDFEAFDEDDPHDDGPSAKAR